MLLLLSLLLLPLLLFFFLDSALAQSNCTLCFGGSDPNTSSLNNTTDLSTVVAYENVTCAELQTFMALVPESACAGYQEIAAIYCGCPDRPDDDDSITCTLCADGSLPEFPDAPVFDFQNPDSTFCRDVIVEAALVDNDSNRLQCQQLQDVGYSNCGCPIESPTDCVMCPSNNNTNNDDEIMIDESREIIPHVTCGNIARFMTTLSGTQCTAYQKVFAEYCGCSSSVMFSDTAVCRICGDRFVDNPATAVDLSGLPTIPCVFYETIANDASLSAFPCSDFQTEADLCCSNDNNVAGAPSSSGSVPTAPEPAPEPAPVPIPEPTSEEETPHRSPTVPSSTEPILSSPPTAPTTTTVVTQPPSVSSSSGVPVAGALPTTGTPPMTETTSAGTVATTTCIGCISLVMLLFSAVVSLLL